MITLETNLIQLNSNTTLVKVKYVLLHFLLVVMPYSNTTLVKVKFGFTSQPSIFSNKIQIQHLLKLNVTARMISLVVSAIQIQHLLKLNIGLKIAKEEKIAIQIQHLLKLN